MSGHMMEMERDESLHNYISKVTDPQNECERWDCIQAFYQQVNTQPDGPQVATHLLAHKIQSPQEKEALQALTLLEVCMNNCGKRFHCEATKFRFLNELIKVLSPKYLGNWSSAQVKQRVTEVLYGWTLWLKEEQKVQEAYRMLKKQGLVKADPKLPVAMVTVPPPPRQEASMFDDEEKVKLLSRLLKSRRPEDLQTANRLIKSTVQEDQEKLDRESKRICTLEEVERLTTQLTLLLQQQQHTQEMQDLYERCDKLRPNLFRLASETVDNDDALGEILRTNDKLARVMTLYREKIHKQETETETPPTHNHGQELLSPVRTYHLMDMSDVSVVGVGAERGHQEESSSILLLQEDTHHHGESDSVSRAGGRSYLDELLQLEGGEKVVQAGRETEATGARGDFSTHNASLLTAMDAQWSRSTLSDLQNQDQNQQQGSPLTDLTVPLESIKPSHIKPIMMFDRHGISVSLHFTKEAPPTRSDVAVFVVSAVNTSSLPVCDFLFLASVPKCMEVKLQPATGSVMQPYSPLLPPAALSQILLLHNPLQKPVRLRFRLTLKLGDERLQHEGEIERFPQWSSWTHL